MKIKSTTNINNAIKNDSPIVREELTTNICFDWELGDKESTNKTLEKSHHITEIELVNNRLIPNPMECRSTIGQYSENGTFNLYCSSQGVHSLKKN